MKNRPVTANSGLVSEWEDGVLFDADDPDFCNVNPNVSNVLNGGATGDSSANNATSSIIMPPPPPLIGAISSGSHTMMSSFNFKGKLHNELIFANIIDLQENFQFFRENFAFVFLNGCYF